MSAMSGRPDAAAAAVAATTAAANVPAAQLAS